MADRLLSDLLADPLLGSVVAEPIIQQAIENGDLIPRERLMLAQGFELAPLGRLTDLEDAAISALDALSGDNPNIKAAIDLLWSVVSLPAGGEGDEDAGLDLEVQKHPAMDEWTCRALDLRWAAWPVLRRRVRTMRCPVGLDGISVEQLRLWWPRWQADDANDFGVCS